MSDRERNTEAHVGQDDTVAPTSKVCARKRAAAYTVAQCRETAQRLFAVALSATGLTHRTAADAAGVSRTLVAAWAGSGLPRAIPLGRLLAMAQTSRRGRELAIAVLTGALSHVQALPCLAVVRPLRDLVDDFHAEAGELSIAYREAMADGELDDAEVARLTSDLLDVEKVCREIRHTLGARVQTKCGPDCLCGGGAS